MPTETAPVWADVMQMVVSRRFFAGAATALAFRRQVRRAFDGMLSKVGVTGGNGGNADNANHSPPKN